MKLLDRPSAFEQLLRGAGLALYLPAMYGISLVKPIASERSAILGIALVASVVVCLVVDFVVRTRFGLKTRFAIRANPLARQGLVLLGVLFIAGYLLEIRLSSRANLSVVLYCAVVFFWVSALVTILKLFRRQA